MFGSVAQTVTKTKSSLPALKELPNDQKAPEAQVKATKKPGRWCPDLENSGQELRIHKGLTTCDILPRRAGKLLQHQER